MISWPKKILLLIGLAGVVFVLVNWQMLWTRFQFLSSPPAQDIESVESVPAVKQGVSPLRLRRLVIPSLAIDAPIIAPPEDLTEDVNRWVEGNLDNGVVLYPSGARDLRKENIALFGHSSAINWGAPYATVFAVLDQLNPPAEFQLVTDDGSILVYDVVSEPEIIDTDRLDIVRPEAGAGIATLVTCWPPGTTWKRLMVKGELRQ